MHNEVRFVYGVEGDFGGVFGLFINRNRVRVPGGRILLSIADGRGAFAGLPVGACARGRAEDGGRMADVPRGGHCGLFPDGDSVAAVLGAGRGAHRSFRRIDV